MSTTSIYPESVRNSIPPTSFGEEVDDAVEEIRAATKGFGTDEKRLIQALAGKSPGVRYEISLRYKQTHGKSLEGVIDSECGNKAYAVALKYLSLPPDEAEASMIDMATKGIGAREKFLYPILCGRTNEEMSTLRNAYFDRYDKDLAVELNSEADGTFKDFIMHCLQAGQEEYNEEYHTPEMAEKDADGIREACKGWGTNDKKLFQIICRSPPQHLEAIDAAYQAKHGKTLIDALKKELGGDVEDAIVFAIGMKVNPAKTAAELIREACAGFGTDEKLLTCTIIRYQNIMQDVNVAHQELYGKSVADRVKSEIGGQFEDVLVAVVEA